MGTSAGSALHIWSRSSKKHDHLRPRSAHPKRPLDRLQLTVALERHFWHERGAVCHTYYPRSRLESNSRFVRFFCLRRARSQIFPPSLISPFMPRSCTWNRWLHSVHIHLLGLSAAASPSLRHLSLIEMDERGYQRVWVESSADRLNQGRSFTHRKPIHPGTHTHTRTHTFLTQHTLSHKHTAPKWLPSL